MLKETVPGTLLSDRVALEGMVLKPNMAISGKKCAKRAGVEEVAERPCKMLKNCVPGAVPGIAFLSGGQSDEEATAASRRHEQDRQSALEARPSHTAAALQARTADRPGRAKLKTSPRHSVLPHRAQNEWPRRPSGSGMDRYGEKAA